MFVAESELCKYISLSIRSILLMPMIADDIDETSRWCDLKMRLLDLSIISFDDLGYDIEVVRDDKPNNDVLVDELY